MKDFVPDDDKIVRMYVCGPTVYDDPHLGHARSILSFDSIRRIFMMFGHEVRFVLNYTDVDDKIINKSNDTGQSVSEITSKYIKSYENMLSQLKVMKPTVQPRATEHIKEMLDLIKKMEEKGYTYVSNGSVYFDTSKISWYKDLFKKFSDEEEEVLSVDIGEYVEDKRNPNDFVLWKTRKENEPFWDSPWGPGRPGWHIECSAMSMKYLGEVLTIHGGGQDLKFPHHQNEIAQTRSVTGKDFARYWLHNGFVTVDGTKMAKSLGNFITVDTIIEKYSGNILRFFLLSTHYRNPISLSEVSLDQAQTTLKRIQMFYSRVKKYLNNDENIIEDSKADEETKKGAAEIEENALKFYTALANDFNTAEALSVLFVFMKSV
jgi:cysteinyl-tRNA synthetase